MRVLALCAMLFTVAALAYEEPFVITDITGRAWGPEVVSYDVEFPAPMKAAELTLLGPDGKAIPVQYTEVEGKGGSMKSATVSFLAAVPANASVTYKLTEDDAPNLPAPVSLVKGKGFLELKNEAVAIRLGPKGSLKAEKPVPASELPGPFAGFRQADGAWAGGSKLVTKRKANGYSAEILAEGPVYAEVQFEYKLEGDAFYRVVVRLDQGAPMAFVTEEFISPALTDGTDYLAVSLGKNFPTLDDPDQYAYPWKSGDFGKITPLVNSTFTAVAPWDMFGSRMYYEMDAATKIGLLVLHSGSWRHPHNAVARLRARADQPTVLELPFSCYGVLRPYNPFDSAEDDPGDPDTYGSRYWGLTLADGDRKAQRLQYGFIGLDTYKDWILTWRDPAGEGAAPPHTYVNFKEAGLLKATLPGNPYKDTLSKLYIMNPTDANGANSTKAALGWLDKRLKEGVSNTGSSFRQAQYDNGIVPFCDDALAWPNLPTEQRAALRAKIAAICYLYTEPDFNPRGLGDHLGNPNMPINRYMGFPQYIQLVKAHPLYKLWMKDAVAYTEWKLADNTSPYGAWREEQGYQQASVPFITDALLSLNHAGAMTDNMLEYAVAIHKYMLAVLSPPDANMKGLRACEGTGNGVISRGDSLPNMARLMRDKDPIMAATLMWAWEAMGKSPGNHGNMTNAQWLGYDPSIEAKQPNEISGAFLPGFGATSRTNFGQPSESFLLFRQGYNQSHFDMDQGSFKIYANGEQVVPNSSLGYNSPEPAEIRHGIVTFGGFTEWQNNHGRVDSMIIEHVYLQTADYLCGRQRFDHKSGGSSNGFVKQPFDWYRQFLTMKSQNPLNPTYYVLRDSFRGPQLPATHWFCWLLGKPQDITVEGNRVTVKTPQGNYLDIVFANLTTVKPTFTYKATAGGSGCGFPPGGATLMRVDQLAGKDYLVVIYPRTADMKRPQVACPAPGVVQVTAQDSIDWAFLNPDQDIDYTEEMVAFKGRSGAIHRNMDWSVSIAICSGGGKARCRNYTYHTFMPMERIKTRQELEAGGGGNQYYKYEPVVRKLDIRYADKTEVKPGVTKFTLDDGYAYVFASKDPLEFNQDDIVFKGEMGAVFVTKDYMRLVMGRDFSVGALGYIGYKDFVIRGEGPYDLVFTYPKGDEPGEVTGLSDGRARVLEMPLPQNLAPDNCRQLAMSRDMIPAQNDGPVLTGIAPTLYLNGRQWQVGYYDRGLALPLFEGKNDIRLTRFQVPPVGPWAYVDEALKEEKKAEK